MLHCLAVGTGLIRTAHKMFCVSCFYVQLAFGSIACVLDSTMVSLTAIGDYNYGREFDLRGNSLRRRVERLSRLQPRDVEEDFIVDCTSTLNISTEFNIRWQMPFQLLYYWKMHEQWIIRQVIMLNVVQSPTIILEGGRWWQHCYQNDYNLQLYFIAKI